MSDYHYSESDRFSVCFRRAARWRAAVLLFWLSAAVTSAFFALQFFSATNNQLQPPPGSLAAQADQLFQQEFPTQSATATLIVLLESHNNQSLIAPDNPLLPLLTEYYLSALNHYSDAAMFFGLDGYETFINTSLAALAVNYVADQGCASVLSISYDRTLGDSRLDDFVAFSRSLTASAASQPFFPPDHSIGITGIDPLFLDVEKGTENDMVRIVPHCTSILCYGSECVVCASVCECMRESECVCERVCVSARERVSAYV